MSFRRLPMSCLAVALVVAAGCRERAMPAAADAAPPAPAPAPAAEPIAMPQTPAGPAPASGTLTYAGFGPAAFGADAEAVRMAWGKDLTGAPAEPGGCHFLASAPRGATPPPVAFLIEGGKFARIDVATPDLVAPGGGTVGTPASRILALHPDAQSMPHKYLEGARTLRVANPAGSNAALVFETDAQDVVVAWRIGVPPQIDYVEGCG
ncbi:MAG: lectin [Lysobacteraceae bacterium]